MRPVLAPSSRTPARPLEGARPSAAPAGRTAAPQPLPAGQANKAYDGALMGADGTAWPVGTPLSAVKPALPRGRPAGGETILYVNGIDESPKAFTGNMQKLADSTGQKVVGLYNAAEGVAKDVWQTAQDRLNLGRNPAVDALADHVYAQLKAGQPVRLAAHSQGGLVVSRALSDAKARLRLEDGLSGAQAERLLSRVSVETFASAAGCFPDGPAYVHYVNRADPVTLVSGMAFGTRFNPLVHVGRGAQVHTFFEKKDYHLQSTYFAQYRTELLEAAR